MKNRDIHEWLIDNCIDSMLTIKDTKGAEIYLTDLLTKHLTEQLQQHSVGGPASASALEGEQLGNEGSAKSVRGGKCKHCGQTREGHTVIGMCMDRFKHFESA